MSREHKYRAWHKTKKQMMLFELSELNDSMITKVDDGWYLDDCEVMQYTGLHDAKGIEIYEGDIVITQNEQEGEYPVEDEYRGEVIYVKDHFAIKQFHDTYTPLLSNYTIVSIEVIGNIYEHPHLIANLNKS